MSWQMFAVETPYEGYSVKMFEKSVIKGGSRPKINEQKWGKEISTFMKDSFVSNPNRPSMNDACEILRDEINKLSDDEITDILDASRKSQLSAN